MRFEGRMIERKNKEVKKDRVQMEGRDREINNDSHMRSFLRRSAFRRSATTAANDTFLDFQDNICVLPSAFWADNQSLCYVPTPASHSLGLICTQAARSYSWPMDPSPQRGQLPLPCLHFVPFRLTPTFYEFRTPHRGTRMTAQQARL